MIPEWTGAVEGWSKRWVRTNFWRVEVTLGSREDALQQCGMIFAKVCRRYETRVDNAAWMMTLYKRALFNHWIILARKETDNKRMLTDLKIEMLEASVYVPSSRLSLLWRMASPELTKVMQTIGNAPAEVLDILLDENAKNLNRRWRRHCEITTQCDLVGELRQMLLVPTCRHDREPLFIED